MGSCLSRGGPEGHCRYTRTRVPPLAVSRQEPCSYPQLRPAAGPLRSGALLTQQRSRTRPLVGKGPGAPRVPGKAGGQPERLETPDLLPKRTGSPGNPGPPMGPGTPCIVTGPLSKERNCHPASGWSGATTCQTGPDTYIRPLGLLIKSHLPWHSLR